MMAQGMDGKAFAAVESRAGHAAALPPRRAARGPADSLATPLSESTLFGTGSFASPSHDGFALCSGTQYAQLPRTAGIRHSLASASVRGAVLAGSARHGRVSREDARRGSPTVQRRSNTASSRRRAQLRRSFANGCEVHARIGPMASKDNVCSSPATADVASAQLMNPRHRYTAALQCNCPVFIGAAGGSGLSLKLAQR